MQEDRATANDALRVLAWSAWIACLLWHPLLTFLALPTIVAIHRQHRHPVLILVCNVAFAITPAIILVLFFAVTGKTNQPSRKTPIKTKDYVEI